MLKRKLKEPFGKAGLTVAILALVLAMVGGAYAAGALSGKQKKEVEKIAKKFAGKPGAAGPTGSNGANGTNGAKGDAGTAGSNGANGTSAEATSFSGEKTPCKEGGIEVKSAKPTVLVCNGVKGATGPVGETAPAGYTMRGEWATHLGLGEEGNGFGIAPVSFPFQLTAPPSESVFIPEAGPGSPSDEEKCPGNAASPEAKAGVMCFYAEHEIPGPVTFQTALLTKQGSSAFFAGASESSVIGTWAVKAP